MRTKQMGIDGPELPVVCFGTWPLGGAYGQIDESMAISTMHAAIDAGLTFIDTAEGYMNAEALIGKAIKSVRGNLFLATKVSGEDHSTEHITSAVENSLALLGTDHIDLYQLHRPSARPIEDTMDDLIRMRDAGKIRYIGVSNFSVKQIAAGAKAGPIKSGQPRYNLLFRETENDILPAHQKNGIGVMAHSVLAKGLLGGRYKSGHIFEKSDERSTWPAFHGESFQKTLAVTEQLNTWARDHGRDLVQLAIAWPVSHPAVYTSIVGARKVQDIPQLAEAGSWTLSLKDLREIDDIQGDHRLFIDDQPAGKTSDE
ncbi:MAG: aldo/keto reductase [Chloroflexota bacterium]|nr:aldo/keto reductase [Chloroflexota bacterium]